MFAFYDALADERHVGLSLSGEGIVDGDRLMMRRALSNLLSNAIRHALRRRHPGVDRRRRRWLGSPARREPGADDVAEHLPRLFDRFYRVDASRVKEGDGSGLGLAITKTIVEAHRGRSASPRPTAGHASRSSCPGDQ
ncbi:MAG: ATP-binding protein [Burkholderiaceae bacterium]